MREPRPMLHEWAFAGFLLSVAVRSAVAAGLASRGALTYAALAVAVPLEACALARLRHPLAWRLRLFATVPLMCWVFADLRQALPVFHPAHMDALLQAWDQGLFGASPPQLLAGHLGAGADDALSLCYGLFFPYLLWLTLSWAWSRPMEGRAFYGGLLTLYAIGFTGYTLLPALGPYAAMAFPAPLAGGVPTRLLLRAVPLGTNRADAFPSLHCAVTAFLLGFDLLAGHWRRAACCAVPVAGLWLSTLALRFHYATDVLAGFALAGFCLVLSAALLHRKGLSYDPLPRPA